MHKQIGTGDILPGSQANPHEACLTLYFEKKGVKDVLAFLGEVIDDWVNNWEEKYPTANGEIKQLTYTHKNTPSVFDSLYMIVFEPWLTTDTLAVQFIVNITFPSFSEGFKITLDWFQNEIFTKPVPEEFLGSTLIFKLNTLLSFSGGARVEASILNGVSWPFLEKPKPLEFKKGISETVLGGQTWIGLLGQIAEPHSSLLYLVITNPNTHIKSQDIFATRTGPLSTLDLFVHKGIMQGHELNKSYSAYQNNVLDPFQATLAIILSEKKPENKNDPYDITRIKSTYLQITTFNWHIERLIHSLEQQVNGIARVAIHNVFVNDLAEYYTATLTAYITEGVAVSKKVTSLLNITKTSLSFIEASLLKRNTERQERFNTIVTFIGLFLAADQILDHEFGKNLLLLVYSKPDEIPFWLVFGARLLISLSSVGLILSIIKKVVPRKW